MALHPLAGSPVPPEPLETSFNEAHIHAIAEAVPTAVLCVPVCDSR